jgi:hypothetical protein
MVLSSSCGDSGASEGIVTHTTGYGGEGDVLCRSVSLFFWEEEKKANTNGLVECRWRERGT